MAGTLIGGGLVCVVFAWCGCAGSQGAPASPAASDSSSSSRPVLAAGPAPAAAALLCERAPTVVKAKIISAELEDGEPSGPDSIHLVLEGPKAKSLRDYFGASESEDIPTFGFHLNDDAHWDQIFSYGHCGSGPCQHFVLVSCGEGERYAVVVNGGMYEFVTPTEDKTDVDGHAWVSLRAGLGNNETVELVFDGMEYARP